MIGSLLQVYMIFLLVRPTGLDSQSGLPGEKFCFLSSPVWYGQDEIYFSIYHLLQPLLHNFKKRREEDCAGS